MAIFDLLNRGRCSLVRDILVIRLQRNVRSSGEYMQCVRIRLLGFVMIDCPTTFTFFRWERHDRKPRFFSCERASTIWSHPKRWAFELDLITSCFRYAPGRVENAKQNEKNGTHCFSTRTPLRPIKDMMKTHKRRSVNLALIYNALSFSHHSKGAFSYEEWWLNLRPLKTAPCSR